MVVGKKLRRGTMNYHKTVISLKKQAKRRLAALFSGNQNNSPAAFEKLASWFACLAAGSDRF